MPNKRLASALGAFHDIFAKVCDRKQTKSRAECTSKGRPPAGTEDGTDAECGAKAIRVEGLWCAGSRRETEEGEGD